MKTLLLILTVICVAGCASAEPPAHVALPTLTLTCAAPAADTPPISGVNFLAANHADNSWRLIATVPCTNGDIVSFSTAATNELFAAQSTNSVTGGYSDYSAEATNSVVILTAPAVSVK